MNESGPPSLLTLGAVLCAICFSGLSSAQSSPQRQSTRSGQQPLAEQGSASSAPGGTPSSTQGKCGSVGISVAILAERGNQAMVQRRYAEALECYERAHSTSGDPRYLYNTARALELLKRPVLAYRQLRQFSEQASDPLKSRVPQLGELLESYRAQVGRVQLEGAPPGARASVDGTTQARAPFAQPLVLSPGQARLVVTAPSYAPFETHLVIAAGQLIRLTVEMRRLGPGEAPDGGASEADPNLEPKPDEAFRGAPLPVSDRKHLSAKARALRGAAFGSLALGVASGGLAATFYGLARSSFNKLCKDEAGATSRPPCEAGEVDSDEQRKYRTRGGLYVGSLIASGIGLGAFGVLYWKSTQAKKSVGLRSLRFEVAPKGVLMSGDF